MHWLKRAQQNFVLHPVLYACMYLGMVPGRVLQHGSEARSPGLSSLAPLDCSRAMATLAAKSSRASTLGCTWPRTGDSSRSCTMRALATGATPQRTSTQMSASLQVCESRTIRTNCLDSASRQKHQHNRTIFSREIPRGFDGTRIGQGRTSPMKTVWT